MASQGTEKLRDVAQHHREEAERRRKTARDYYVQGEKVEAASNRRAAAAWRAMGDAELKVAENQQAEADRLTIMADVYDELPEPPSK